MKDVLNELCSSRTISRDTAREVLIGIAEGDYAPELVASFLTVFRMRSVTVDELLGFRDAMLDLSLRPELSDADLVDLCGTGGDGKDTFNISTLASFVAAGAGVKVAKHGNVSVSSSCGSSDVLQELGVCFTSDSVLLQRQLDRANICYLHAPLFHPAMKNVAPIRRALGVRTFFNLLGPLVNPARVSLQVIGVFSGEIARLFHYLLSEEDRAYVVLHSLDGYDEVSLTGRWRVFGSRIDQILSPEEVGLCRVLPEDLTGGEPTAAAQLFRTVLQGGGSEQQNAVVASNAAYAIQLWRERKGEQLSFPECYRIAMDSLISGAAAESFNELVRISAAGSE
ncbi:anthranilate phosphoribosyltransferase [bacterium]|nr:anthranilate phosphoribosyltransferase [bacterium]